MSKYRCLNPKLLLKVFPVLFMSFVQLIGTGAVARSQTIGPLRTPQVEAAGNSIPALIELLKHSDPKVRSSAANAFGNMGEAVKAAIPSLIPLLKDAKTWVRSSAAEALKKLDYKP